MRACRFNAKILSGFVYRQPCGCLNVHWLSLSRNHVFLERAFCRLAGVGTQQLTEVPRPGLLERPVPKSSDSGTRSYPRSERPPFAIHPRWQRWARLRCPEYNAIRPPATLEKRVSWCNRDFTTVAKIWTPDTCRAVHACSDDRCRAGLQEVHFSIPQLKHLYGSESAM